MPNSRTGPKVQKWGNSLAVRIPKPYAEEAGLHADTEVRLTVREGALVVTPRRAPSYALSDLLSEVKPSNLHREVASGDPEGSELW